MTHSKRMLIAVDQLVNTVFNGWPDETISSRVWRWHKTGKRYWPRKLIDVLFFWIKTIAKKVMKANVKEGNFHQSYALKRWVTV